MFRMFRDVQGFVVMFRDVQGCSRMFRDVQGFVVSQGCFREALKKGLALVSLERADPHCFQPSAVDLFVPKGKPAAKTELK